MDVRIGEKLNKRFMMIKLFFIYFISGVIHHSLLANKLREMKIKKKIKQQK